MPELPAHDVAIGENTDRAALRVSLEFTTTSAPICCSHMSFAASTNG